MTPEINIRHTTCLPKSNSKVGPHLNNSELAAKLLLQSRLGLLAERAVPAESPQSELARERSRHPSTTGGYGYRCIPISPLRFGEDDHFLALD